MVNLPTKREKTFFVVAIVLIGLGGYALCIGIVILYNDSIKKTGEILSEEIAEFKLGHLISYTLSPPEGKKSFYEGIKINFDSDIVFQNDEVGVRINAYNVDPQVASILIMFDNPNVDVNSITAQYLLSLIEMQQPSVNIVKLTYDSSPPFQTVSKIPFPIAGQQVSVYSFFLDSNDKIIDVASRNNIFTVYSATDKIQAETNFEMQKQINATIISEEIQNRKTDVIIGLTWIATGAIPFVIAADIFIRLFLETKKKQSPTNQLTS